MLASIIEHNEENALIVTLSRFCMCLCFKYQIYYEQKGYTQVCSP